MRFRSLPRILRPLNYENEKLESFVSRVEGRIVNTPGSLRSIARGLNEDKDHAIVLATLATMVEQLTDLEPGTFSTDALGDSSSQNMGARLLCLECSDGEDVELIPHEDHHCCLKHGRWTGPEPEIRKRSGRSAYRLPQRGPWSSNVVGDDVLQADQVYRSLQAEGRAPIKLMRELIDIIDQSDGGGTSGIPTPANYVTVVSLLDLLTDSAFHIELFNPMVTYADAGTLLKNRIDTVVPGSSDELVEHVWLLLRPDFLAIHEALTGVTAGSTGVVDIDIDSIITGRTVIRPLEPFSRIMSQKDKLEWGAWCQRYLLPGQSDVPRRMTGQGAKRHEFICIRGHRYRAAPNPVFRVVQQGNSGCPYCSGRAALAGFNSMADINPRLATQWHPELNGDTKPSQITASGNSKKYWWQCERDHAWQETPNNRARGRGCPYCSGKIVIEGESSLDVTHPAIANEWDSAANGTLKPEDIRPGSGKKVAWICPSQHRYTATVDARTGRGTGCPVCANLQVLSGFNDLATTHPQIAAEWDYERNGTIRPDNVVAGSKTKRHWVCPREHRYTAAPVTRVAGKGCAVCANKQVLAGFNDLVTMNAAVAKEWHPTLNGELSPTMVTVSSGKKAIWLCSLDHVYEQVIAKRTTGSGCPICANKKVLPGFNDLATRYPDIVKDWHPTKNLPLRATEILPGNNPRWWLCQYGHEQLGTVPNRLKTLGCSACSSHERAGADPTERSDCSGK